MQYQLLASDFDNTLVPFGEPKPHPAVVRAVKKMQAAGGRFVLSTGRGYCVVSKEQLGGIRFDYAITCNGACVVDKNGTVVAEHPLTNEEMYALVDFCEDYNYPLQFNHEKFGHLGLHFMQTGGVGRDGWCCYDVVRGGMDKGVGLSDLCEKMGLTLADAVAAGDSANDVGMLKAAGLGCCMANGTADAKAAADRVIGDVREDGLAALIEELWFDGPQAVPSGRDLGSAWDAMEKAGMAE